MKRLDKKHMILIAILFLTFATLLFLKNNEEHFAKKRFCDVNEIIVRWVYDGNGNYSEEGFEKAIISNQEDVEEWKNMLYSIKTEGHWFTSNDGPQWDYYFTVDVCYNDGYIETIFVQYKTRSYKRIDIATSYAIGDSEKLYQSCYDLFFDEPHAYLPAR